jgi:hypothetical protein
MSTWECSKLHLVQLQVYNMHHPSMNVFLWRVSSSGIWRRVVCWVATDVSEEHIASIFRVEACHLLTCWFLLKLFLWPWRGRRYVPPKRRLQLNRLHGVISQKMVLFITTAVKTSNPTCFFAWSNLGFCDKLHQMEAKSKPIHKATNCSDQGFVKTFWSRYSARKQICLRLQFSGMCCDLRFSQQWLWRVIPSGIYCYVVHWKSTNILEEHVTSIFMVKE